MRAKYLISGAAFAALHVVTSAFAQPIVSPEVQTDGKVTFRLRAPNATSVEVHCEGVRTTAMQKDDHGVWSLTTDALEPDIYTYSFSVEGVRLLDPGNPAMKYNLLNSESELHVPGPASLSWELNDVPRGRLHRHFYKSAVAGDERDFYVYTPPGYDPASRKRYPALYLLHGYSDDASSWSTAGRANVILDNLIARGQAKPMVVVMPLGYGAMDIVLPARAQGRERATWQQNMDKFGDALLNEVLPQAESAYRISTDRKSRAIAGLSMGGSESLTVGLNHLDRFAWVGSFSMGGLTTNYDAAFPSLNAAASKPLRLLWIGCGEQDGLLKPNEQFCNWLKSKDVPFTWVHTPGQHSYRVWRRYLAEFTPLLFQDKTTK